MSQKIHTVLFVLENYPAAPRAEEADDAANQKIYSSAVRGLISFFGLSNHLPEPCMVG